MKASDKAMLGAAAGGVITGGLLFWFLPGAAWWFPVLIGCLVAGGLHHQLLKDAATKRMANGEFEPKQ